MHCTSLLLSKQSCIRTSTLISTLFTFQQEILSEPCYYTELMHAFWPIRFDHSAVLWYRHHYPNSGRILREHIMHCISWRKKKKQQQQKASSDFREIVVQDLFVQIASSFAKLVLCESEMKCHCSVTCYCVVIGGCLLLLLTLASQSMSRMMRSF